MVFQPCVYILAARPRGAIYVGITRDIALRVWLHKQGRASKHTAKYKINQLVWYEFHATIPDAVAREKRLKNWRRAWKLELIENANPTWIDLYSELNC